VLACTLLWPCPGAARNATPPENPGSANQAATQDKSATTADEDSGSVGNRSAGASDKQSAGTEARGTLAERPSPSPADDADQGAEKPAPRTERDAEPMPGGNVGWSGYFQALGAIFLIIAVLAVGFFLLKRYGPSAMGGGVFGRGALQLEAQLPLGPKRSVAVVRFLNKRLVLGVTDSHITLLTETETGHDDELTDHTPTAHGGSAFSKMLAKARNPRA
jgi:flagellar protein FliO/FliZ